MAKMADPHGECRHLLVRNQCSICIEQNAWGKLKSAPYRRAIRELTPLSLAVPETVRLCKKCKRHGANKGNRINVRLPRSRESFSVGPKLYAPSWEGEIVTRPKVRHATHKHNGDWLCDKCDPERAVGELPTAPAIFTRAMLIAR